MNIYKENFTSFFHWFAWTIAIIASLFFLAFDVRENIVSYFHFPNLSVLLIIIALLISITGSFYSLFRQVRGGVIMIIGGIAIVVYYYFTGGIREFPFMLAYGFPFIIPGVFFVFVRR